MHEGTQFRKFEGEEDRNHHGDIANPLYSNAYNMGTSLSGVNMSVGAGMAGYGSGGNKRGMETILKNIHNYTEMNISQFGKEEKKTRVGYKDRQKKDAFIQMTHIGDALSLHQAVLQRAKELFAGFRDDRELVQQFKGVVAGCLCESFDQLSRDGRKILSIRAGEEGTKEDIEVEDKKKLNTRAIRRMELHSSSSSGKGGRASIAEATAVVLCASEEKPLTSWDLANSRSWLIEASKRIAQQWYKKNQEEGISNSESQDEMTGKLVQHALTLCNSLEQEMSKVGHSAVSNGKNKHRVKTPRLRDNEMGRLGIKWQHSHERGSGGAGGVGNSGKSNKGPKIGKTAGQILRLKTKKKLIDVIGDLEAGDAFHRELRALVERQDKRRSQERSNDALLQRNRQMQRKPWLQARVLA